MQFSFSEKFSLRRKCFWLQKFLGAIPSKTFLAWNWLEVKIKLIFYKTFTSLFTLISRVKKIHRNPLADHQLQIYIIITKLLITFDQLVLPLFFLLNNLSKSTSLRSSGCFSCSSLCLFKNLAFNTCFVFVSWQVKTICINRKNSWNSLLDNVTENEVEDIITKVYTVLNIVVHIPNLLIFLQTFCLQRSISSSFWVVEGNVEIFSPYILFSKLAWPSSQAPTLLRDIVSRPTIYSKKYYFSQGLILHQKDKNSLHPGTFTKLQYKI